jgi:transglutaminase-like putative cysteine protease
MHNAQRVLLAAVPASVVIAVAWLRFEQPLGSVGRSAVLVALALAPAGLPRWRLRAAGCVVAAVVAVRLAFGVWLFVHPLGAFSLVGGRFGNGFLDFYATHLPFDPRLHVEMAEVVLIAIFCFALLAALVIAAGKPVASALALLLGAGWPATLLGPSHGFAMGAAILAAGLLVLAVLGSGRIPALALPFASVLVLAAVAVGSATAAQRGAVHWQSWNFAGGGRGTSVSFVWNAQYGGLHWPRKTTVALQVKSKASPNYLRAAVLDDFAADRWTIGIPRLADALEPRAAFDRAHETKESVTIEGLSDVRLVGGSIPVHFTAGAPLDQPEPGFAIAASGMPRGFTYTAWSYAPSPSKAALARAPATYPTALLEGGMLGIGDGIEAPPFGAPGRQADVNTSLSRTFGLFEYVPLARLAEKLTRGARTPYAAVADLEHWFLVSGGFRYSNQPPVVDPPLVGFATETRAGYCQYFAGAMALMLRYVGIPARVAVGFAGPTYDTSSRSWVFTDHDAHAWVEAWFRGYGWLPFDPTPAAPGSSRAQLVDAFTKHGGSGESSPVSTTLPHVPSAKGIKGVGGLNRLHLGHAAGANTGPPAGGGRFSLAYVFLLVVAGLVAAVAAAKEARRLARRLERDPRRLAAACREELASFLLDQGMEPARSATVRELGALVRRQLGVDAHAFVAAATAARFGRPEDAGEAARAARRELRKLLAECRRYLSRRERLLGLFSLRSLVRLRPAGDVSAAVGSTS